MDPRLVIAGVVDWHIMETVCSCWRRNCRHKRQDAARRLRTDQLEALTETDVDGLLAMGWTP